MGPSRIPDDGTVLPEVTDGHLVGIGAAGGFRIQMRLGDGNTHCQLAGEEPIDHIQKDFLRTRATLHPTMSAVMQLHVAEEARHISFAHHLIRAWAEEA